MNAPQPAGYSEFTIRELLKMVGQLCCTYRSLGADNFERKREELLAFAAYAVYAARFRKAEARRAVLDVIGQCFGSPCRPDCVKWESRADHGRSVYLDDVQLVRAPLGTAADALTRERMAEECGVPLSTLPLDLLSTAARVHAEVWNNVETMGSSCLLLDDF